MDFTLLLDSPREPRRTVQIAKLGEDFEHSRYGKFAITAQDIESWKRNLDALPGKRALIDEDHSADRTPRRTEASGWITDVRLKDGTPVADIDWTSKGEQAIRDGRYLFISPTFGDFKDEQGATHENTLIGAALTNRPFLNMPSLCLASDERVSEAIDADPAARFYTRALDGELGETVAALVSLDVDAAERKLALKEGNSLPDGSYPIRNTAQLHAAAILAASGHGDAAAARKLIRRRAKDLGVELKTLPGFGAKSLGKSADSRPPMATATDLLKTLGLEEDTELTAALDSLELDDGASQKLLDAATELRTKAEAPAPKPEVKTLEQQASENGQVLLDADQWQKTQREATAGATAMKQLHDQAFEHAFEKALAERKVVPAERDSLQHFYTLDAEATIRSLESREAVLPDKPHGAPAIDLDAAGADPDALVQAGIHPGSHDVDRAIRAKLRESGRPDSDYHLLLDEFMQNGRLL